MDEAAVVQRTARGSDEDVLAWLEGQVAQPPAELRSLYAHCSAEARAALINMDVAIHKDGRTIGMRRIPVTVINASLTARTRRLFKNSRR